METRGNKMMTDDERDKAVVQYRIFLRQHYIFKYPKLRSIAWTTISCVGENKDTFSAYDKGEDGSGDGVAKMIPYPGNLHQRQGVATVSWRSSLFFISGADFSRKFFRPRSVCCEPTVCAFDTRMQEWKVFKPIGTPRYNHTAVVVKDNIYVFGTSNKIPEEYWAEEFDILSNEWNYLTPPPQEWFSREGRVFASAVYPQKPLILFPLRARRGFNRIYAFNCEEREWLPFIELRLAPDHPPIYPQRPLILQDKLTVMQDVLFWHYAGTIWGYDLNQGHFLGSLFDLPGDLLLAEKFEISYPPTYLLPVGDQNLFLIWSYDVHDKYRINCYKFEVQTRWEEQPDGTRIRLVLETSSVICTESIGRFELYDALVLSS